MAPTPLVVPFGLGPLIGIIAGGAVVLVLIVLTPTVLILRQRHKRALRQADENATTQLKTFSSASLDSKRHSVPRISVIPAEAANAKYNTLASNENLRDDFRKSARTKRKSADLLSWPLPRRLSKHGENKAQRLSQLSAISEDNQRNSLLDKKRVSTASTAPGTPKVASSPPAQITPSFALRPLPLFSGRDGRPNLERSVSVPSVLSQSPDPSTSRTTSNTVDRETRVRSFSLTNLGIQLSSETLPPLPAPPKPVAKSQGRENKRGSALSIASISSVGTATSSILDQSNTPRPVSTTIFGNNKSEVGLGLKDVSYTQGSVDLASTNIFAASAAKNAANANRHSVGQVHTVEHVRLNRISASPTPTQIRAVNTPKRDAHMRKASYCGSPEDKEQISVFREVSGNSMMPSRELSQASFLTIDSVASNPFAYSPTPPTLQPQPKLKSALKKRSSPGSRKLGSMKKNVRVSSVATSYWAPVYDHSPSPRQMHDIREEMYEDDGDITNYAGDAVEELDNDYDDEDEENETPSPSPSPNAELKAMSYTASLNPTSPTLSMTGFEEDLEADNRGVQSRQSVASSVISLSTFPIPLSHNWARITSSEAGKSDIASTPATSNPDSPLIPGLTLLAQTTPTKNTLPFPTIEIETSQLNFNPPQNDASPAQGPGPSLLSTPTTPSDPPYLPQNDKSWTFSARPLSLSSPITMWNSAPDFSAPRPAPTPPSSSNPLAPSSATNIKDATTQPTRLSGPRHPPAKSTMNIIRTLRRENSDVKKLYTHSREMRRFASIGREQSPNLSNNDLFGTPPPDMKQSYQYEQQGQGYKGYKGNVGNGGNGGSEWKQTEPEEGDLSFSVWEDGVLPEWRPASSAPITQMMEDGVGTPKGVKRMGWATGGTKAEMDVDVENQENREVLVESPLSHGHVF